VDKVCKNCAHRIPSNSIFCNLCGAKVSEDDTTSTADIKVSREKTDRRATLRRLPADIEKIGLALYLLDDRRAIKLEKKDSIVLGRAVLNTSNLPDVDFGPFEGFSKGVSRKHAIIHKDEKGVFISDLRSSNGTFVNHERLKPHEWVALTHGDIISLGRLQLQFLRYQKG
jgi:pSer/pThr/pTyr-binding forkhead associated (FHA) protein